MEDQMGEIRLTISLVLPVSVMGSKESIAQYLNDKLDDDPEFFGWFDEENIEITQPVLE